VFFLFLRFEKQLREKLSQKSTNKLSEEAYLLKTFKFFDLDDNGYVNFNEFISSLQKIGIILENEKVRFSIST
jgi:Ca2+-binding EF-hand superfamily protein